MSNMPSEGFLDFGIVMATVCVPFFFLIGSLNTTQGMAFWRSKYENMISWVFDRDRWGKKRAEKGEGKESKSDDGNDTDCVVESPGMFPPIRPPFAMQSNEKESKSWTCELTVNSSSTTSQITKTLTINQHSDSKETRTDQAAHFTTASLIATSHIRINSTSAVGLEIKLGF